MQQRTITLPVESGKEELSLQMAEMLGADALRNSDGTDLPEKMLDGSHTIYATLCLVRADQQWAKNHLDYCCEKYLMSDPVTARSKQLKIYPMQGFFAEKYIIDKTHDPKRYWEVIDRTIGETVSPSDWDFNLELESVTVNNCQKYHQYTISFLVYQIWDSVSMYNHISNNWDQEHIIAIDPYIPEAYNQMMAFLEIWLDKNPQVDVVRLTTLAYNFTIDSDKNGNPKFVDWLGYTDCISPLALDDFERQYGYRLRPEDFVNNGYYNDSQMVPSDRFRDWMNFIQQFVIKFGREIVERIHGRGKKTAIFWGDHWIGTEPYSPLYQSMAIDINIGACEDGNALRRLADAPGNQVKEIRLYPYFFPDVFSETGDPTAESMANWLKIRRAILRKPIDRIGWGGYLSLLEQKPDFIEHIKQLADEFQSILDHGRQTKPYSNNVNIVILNAWGSLRSWINPLNIEQKFGVAERADVVTIFGSNLQECLAGLPVNISFLSFDELLAKGIPDNTDVIINEGVAGSAWSGGRYWGNAEIIAKIREFIDLGGGIIGCNEPSAVNYGNNFFQLSDIFGVEKECGKTITHSALPFEPVKEHFILADGIDKIDLGNGISNVFSTCSATKVLLANGRHILASASQYGKGRAVYLTALPFCNANCRLLYRAIIWVAQQESNFNNWLAHNPDTECTMFPATGYLAVVNNSATKQQTLISAPAKQQFEIELAPFELKWLNIGERITINDTTKGFKQCKIK